jgi:hypothetical protein
VPQAGDLLVLKPAPARFIWRGALPMAALFMPTPLRRVVKSPARPEGELIGQWRLAPQT